MKRAPTRAPKRITGKPGPVTVGVAELRNLRQLRRLLRDVMEAGMILLLADEETNRELIRLSGARGVE